MTTMILLVGIPGAGKSFHIPVLAQKYEATIISLDTIRKNLTGSESDNSRNQEVLDMARTAVHESLAAGTSVIIDATNVIAPWRQTWIQIAQDYGIPVHTILIDTPLATCIQRNYQRSRTVPLCILVRFYRWLQAELVSGVFVPNEVL